MTEKIKNILKNHKYLIGAFLIPFLIMEIIAVLQEVQPFGTQSFLIVDALHQYLPFFADYQEKLQSADSLFYSFHGGLGYNFWGLWAYYLSSPLNLIIIFFPKDMLNMVLSHLLIIKIALCCFTAAFYFYKRRGKEEFSIIVFGMAYGFSSYIVGYSWNIMWLEVMILLPVILYGFDKMMQGKGWRTYCAALFLSLWCNFYMSFMTCLFLVLWFLFYEHSGMKAFFKNGIRFALCSLLSAAMAAIVLVPAYIGIMKTSSAQLEFPEDLWYGTFGNIFSRHFLGTTPLTMSVDDSDINLYCGILTLLMALFYLLSGQIRKSIRIRKLILLAFLFLSFNMPVLGYIWHGFHNQYGIPNRFAFLYIFLLISMAYDGYRVFMENGRGQVWKIYLSFAGLCILSGIAAYTAEKEIEQKAILWTAGIGIVYLLIFGLYQTKILRKKIAAGILCTVFAGEITAMTVTGFIENGTIDVSDYYQDTQDIQTIKETYDKEDENRIDLASGRMLDESIWHTLNCMTLFGSTAQGSVVDIMDQLGFYTGVNEYLYEGATPFTNNLFSMRYQIYRPYDSRPTAFQPVDTVGNLTVYENPYDTFIGYGMSADVTKNWDYGSLNPFYVQNSLVEQAYGIDDLFDLLQTPQPELNNCRIVSDNGQGEYVIENETAMTDNVTFTIVAEKDEEMYLHFDCGQAENTIIERNGEQIMSGRLNGQILYLGHMEEGEEAKVRIQLEEGTDSTGILRLTLASLDESVMSDVCGEMESQSFKMTKHESSRVEGNITMKEDGIVFFSMPYDEGWKVMVDGKETKAQAVGDAFLGVPVSEGEHEIVLTYRSPGFAAGAVLTGAGFVIFVLITILENRKKKIMKLRKFYHGKYDTLEERKGGTGYEENIC